MWTACAASDQLPFCRLSSETFYCDPLFFCLSLRFFSVNKWKRKKNRTEDTSRVCFIFYFFFNFGLPSFWQSTWKETGRWRCSGSPTSDDLVLHFRSLFPKFNGSHRVWLGIGESQLLVVGSIVLAFTGFYRVILWINKRWRSHSKLVLFFF